MTHLIFTQLLVDERRAALLSDARLVRARAVAAPGPSRRSATRSVPIVGTAMLVAMLMGGCASIKAGAPATVAVQSAAPTSSTAAAPSAVPSTVPSVQPVPPTPRPSSPAGPAPTPSPSTRPPTPTPTLLTGSDRARSVADAYEQALVNGRWSAAWRILSDADQSMRGTFASYVYERKAYFVGVGRRYNLSKPSRDPAVLTMWTSSRDLTRGANLSRGWIVKVSYPALANNNAGWEVLLVAPDRTGSWRVWEVR